MSNYSLDSEVQSGIMTTNKIKIIKLVYLLPLTAALALALSRDARMGDHACGSAKGIDNNPLYDGRNPSFGEA
jgi:hypothetical protein